MNVHMNARTRVCTTHPLNYCFILRNVLGVVLYNEYTLHCIHVYHAHTIQDLSVCPKTVCTFMVCFSPEQESVTSTQYGRFDDSQTSLIKIPLMCSQDFPGNALVSPTADSNLIDRERVVDSALPIAFLNQYKLSIECMTCCVEIIGCRINQGYFY